MNKNIFLGMFFLVLLVSNVNATAITDPINIPGFTSTGGNGSGQNGLIIEPKYNVVLNNVTKFTSANPTIARLRTNINGSDLANATFIGDVAILNYNLIQGTKYYLIADSGISPYTRAWNGSPSFPYLGTNINITGNVIDGGNGTAHYMNIQKVSSTIFSPNFSITLTDSVFSNNICNFTAQINNTLYSSNVSTCNLEANILNSVSLNYSINISSNNYYDKNLYYNISNDLTTTLDPIYTARLNATVFNGSTQVNNYIINITNINTGVITTQIVSNGIAQFNNTKEGENYTVTIDNSSFAFSTQNITLVQGYNTLLFQLQALNSINITIIDELSTSPILQAVTIQFSSATNLFNTTTSTGNYFNSGITPGSYELTFTSTNYSTRTYEVTINNRSTQSLTVRLLSNNQSSAIGIYTKTLGSLVLPNVLYTIQKQYSGGSYATVLQGYTDISGFATFNVQQGTNYKVILEATDYSIKTFNQQFYLANSPYTFNLLSSSSTPYINYLDGVNYYYTPSNTTLINGSYTFQITTYNSTFNIAYTAVNTNGVLVNVTGSSSGGTASNTVDLSNYQGTYPVIYYFSYQDANTGSYETIVIPINYWIESRSTYGNSTITNSMNTFKNDLGSRGWVGILAVFAILASVVTVMQLSQNSLAGIITGMSMLIFFSVIGWVSPALTVVIVSVTVISLYMNRGGY